MASISTDKNGNRRILFCTRDGRRPQITLGKVPLGAARDVKAKIEDLVELDGLAVSPELTRWLHEIPDWLAEKLAAVGLMEARQKLATPPAETVAPFIDSYIKLRQDVKPNTLKTWGQARDLVVEHFGESRDIATVTALDA